jgi:hypothetical protein
MYEYDVFISYRRQRLENKWLTEHFVPVFEWALNNAYQGAREPRYFFDQLHTNTEIQSGDLVDGSGIEPGSRWREELEQAICKSRCMVGLWSLPYFRSRWCQIEWRSFASRTGNPLVAVSVNKYVRRAPEAKNYQMIDISDYMLIGNIGKDGYLSQGFRDAMRGLCEIVVARLEAITEFKNWPIATYTGDSQSFTVPLPTFADAGKSDDRN